MDPPSETVVADALSPWILDSVANNRNHSHIHLLPPTILAHRCFCIKKEDPRAFLVRRVKGLRSKCLKGHSDLVLRFDLAKTEDETVAEIPLIVGVRPARAEPPMAVAVALDVEHVRVAAGVGDAFHRDPEDFAFRLILILEAELRANFRRTELDDIAIEVFPAPLGAEFLGEERVGARCLGEAEIGRSEDHQIHQLVFFNDSLFVGWLGGQVAGIAAHFVLFLASLFIRILNLLEQGIGFDAAQADGLPDLEVDFHRIGEFLRLGGDCQHKDGDGLFGVLDRPLKGFGGCGGEKL